MERRKLGRTGLDVSLLGFGCGAVGGLMTKGAAADQERAIARAVELGINYFDTAQMYGDGESEKNLGRVLKAEGIPVTPADLEKFTNAYFGAPSTDKKRDLRTLLADAEAAVAMSPLGGKRLS